MPSINYGIGRARAAEVRRGLAFRERFESQAEVENNSGSFFVGGSLKISDGLSQHSGTNFIDAIQYKFNPMNQVVNNGYTIIFDIKTSYEERRSTLLDDSAFVAANGTSVYIDNRTGGNHFYITHQTIAGFTVFVDIPFIDLIDENIKTNIAITMSKADSKIRIYKNGVLHYTSSAFPTYQLKTSANLMCVGARYTGDEPFKGLIGNINFFKNQLSDAEILAYFNGTMWTYDQNCVLWMDGKLKRYDPDNNMHKDASRAGNHMAFGDQVTTTTFPTKLATRNGGYGFDGVSDYMKGHLASDLSSDEFTISILGKFNTNDNWQMFRFFDEAKKYAFLSRTGTNFFVGQNNKFTSISTAVLPYESGNVYALYTLVFDRSGDKVDVYYNGRFVTTVTGGTLSVIVGTDEENNIYLASSIAAYGNVNILAFSINDSALNQMQIIDVMLRMQNPEV